MIYWIGKYFSDLRSHFDAIYEVFVTAVFSLVPFFVAIFVAEAKNNAASSSLDDLLGRGQLYLLAYGIYGTIFWLAFVKGDRPRHGARIFLGLISTLLILPVIGFLGVDPTFSTVLNSSLVNAGYWLYALFLFINYLLLFYLNVDPPEPAEVFNREAKAMQKRYKELENG